MDNDRGMDTRQHFDSAGDIVSCSLCLYSLCALEIQPYTRATSIKVILRPLKEIGLSQKPARIGMITAQGSVLQPNSNVLVKPAKNSNTAHSTRVLTLVRTGYTFDALRGAMRYV